MIYQGSNIYRGSNIYQGSNIYRDSNIYQGSNIYQDSNIYQGSNIYQDSNIYRGSNISHIFRKRFGFQSINTPEVVELTDCCRYVYKIPSTKTSFTLQLLLIKKFFFAKKSAFI